MDINNAIKMYYEYKTVKCPDNKTIPISVYRTDDKLELKCKDWRLIITKPKYINIFEHLQQLLDNNDYDKYDSYINKILDTNHSVRVQENNINKIQNDMKILFDKRKEYYNKIDSKLTQTDKDKYIKLYKKKKITNNN